MKTFGFIAAMRLLLSRLNRPQTVAMMAAIVAMFVSGYLANVPALLLGRFVDRSMLDTHLFAAPDFMRSFWMLMALIGASIVVRELFVVGQKYAIEKTATAMEKSEFVRLVAHLMTVKPMALSGAAIGGIVVRIDRSIDGLVRLLKLSFLDFVPTLATASVALWLVWQKQAYVFGLMVVIIAVSVLITFLQIRSQQGIRVNLEQLKVRMGARMVELLNGIDYIRAMGLRRRETRTVERFAEDFRETEFRHHKFMMGFDAAKQLVEGMGFLLVMALGFWLAYRRQLSTGEILTLTILYRSATLPLQQLHRIVDHGHEAVVRLAQLIALYDMPCDEACPPAGWQVPDSGAAVAVVAENVSFFAPAAEGDGRSAILDRVSLRVGKGQKIGLAGLSGSGKTTLIRIILGLLADYEGSLKVFGAEARGIDKERLAALIAYAPQKPFILSGSLRDGLNAVAAGDAGYADERMLQALHKAQLDDFLHRHKDSLDYDIHEQGRNMSGGEQQRLMLARIFLRDAELVILDEATSALDMKTEAALQNSLQQAMTGKAMIVIAHRLSTIQWMDRIYVFEAGRVVQEGTYQALATSPGLFQNMLAQQATESVAA